MTIVTFISTKLPNDSAVFKHWVCCSVGSLSISSLTHKTIEKRIDITCSLYLTHINNANRKVISKLHLRLEVACRSGVFIIKHTGKNVLFIPASQCFYWHSIWIIASNFRVRVKTGIGIQLNNGSIICNNRLPPLPEWSYSQRIFFYNHCDVKVKLVKYSLLYGTTLDEMVNRYVLKKQLFRILLIFFSNVQTQGRLIWQHLNPVSSDLSFYIVLLNLHQCDRNTCNIYVIVSLSPWLNPYLRKKQHSTSTWQTHSNRMLYTKQL